MNDRYGSGAGVLCKVCGDRASGKHYGVPSCDGCRGFFKRSIRRNLEYVCKEGGKCIVDVSRRNQCQACRFSKCLEANMRREAVQHERAPKMTSVTSSTHGMSYAANMYAPRHQDGVFNFPMPFSTVVHPFDNYYMPSPYYPHLTESLNLKFGHGVYKPLLVTPSNYELEIGKILTNNLMTKTAPNAGDSFTKITREKENEVTSSEELPPISDSLRMKTTQSLYDSATKILFFSIRWAKSIPLFNQLPVNDQKSLLNNSWAELFIVAASQWGLLIEGEVVASFPFLKHVQNVFKSFESLKIDNFEAACMKALILFRDDSLESKETSQQHILLLQNQSLCLLLEKCGGLRFGHLLLLLPQIKFCGNVKRLQESLFKHTVGEVLIEKILDDSLL